MCEFNLAFGGDAGFFFCEIPCLFFLSLMDLSEIINQFLFLFFVDRLPQVYFACQSKIDIHA